MTRSKISLELDNKILYMLKTDSLSTRELAEALSVNIQRIYSRCRWLEEHGSLKSTIESHSGLYCMDDRKVVTSECYQDCVDNDHDLRSSPIRVRVWELTVLSKGTSN